jgi:hypothetical protein
VTGHWIGVVALYCPQLLGVAFTSINALRPDPVLLSIDHLHQLIKKCTIGVKWSLDLDFFKRYPPLRGRRRYVYICLAQKKITENTMIKIVTDEEVHEMDIELIELFAVYLFDRDQVGMTDLIYIVEDRMSDDYLETEKQQHSRV